MSNNVLDYVPEGFEPWQHQVDSLQDIQHAWKHREVCTLPAEVAYGKSLIAHTVARWQTAQGFRVAIIAPTVQLQDQYGESFPDMPVIKGMARYACTYTNNKNELVKGTCQSRNKALKGRCAMCPYDTSIDKANRVEYGVFNFFSYKITDYQADVLIIDEAHKLVESMRTMYTMNIWRHIEKYPSNMKTVGDFGMWLEKQIPILERKYEYADETKKGAIQAKIEKYKRIYEGIATAKNSFFFKQEVKTFRGRKQHCLTITPITMRFIPHGMWGGSKKVRVLLMSGTINDIDIEYLGLNRHSNVLLKTVSPIPPEQRPVLINPVAKMGMYHQATSIPKIAKEILNISDIENSTKGMIHLPYALQAKFKPYFKDNPRFMFHTQATKEKQFKKYRESEEPVVLFASGMAEGIDLAGPDYGWQIIAKVLYLNLGDSFVKYQMQISQRWYSWGAVKAIVQQTGRICRGKSDEGKTYILDSDFLSLYNKNKDLFPEYFKSAIQII